MGFPQLFPVFDDLKARPDYRRPAAPHMADNVDYRRRHVNFNLVRSRFDYFEGDRDLIN
jgi:hypothetical protein